MNGLYIYRFWISLCQDTYSITYLELENLADLYDTDAYQLFTAYIVPSKGYYVGGRKSDNGSIIGYVNKYSNIDMTKESTIHALSKIWGGGNYE